MAVHKKHTGHKTEPSSAKATEGQGKEVTSEPKKTAVVSDVVTETTERIEVIEETSEPKSEGEASVEPAPVDPLTDFKEKMSEEEEMPASSNPSQKNFMWPILFVIFLALVSMIGIFIYKQSANKTEEVNVVTLSPTPTTIPEPTKAIDLSKYEIKILNGSEVDGEAGRQKESLEQEGFTVSSVDNADNSDYTDTVIQAKKEVETGFLDKLKSVLEDTFTLGETEILSEDAITPIVVILGTKK